MTGLERKRGAAILITHSRAAADTADRIVELDGRRLIPVASVTPCRG